MTQNPNQPNYQDSYGGNFHEHLLEQYKLYVEMMDKVTERRGQANAFYISLLSALLALLSLLINKDNNLFTGDRNILLLILALLGISLCYIWYTNINSYKQLNSLKFKVINEIESHMPFPCYRREWEILRGDKNNQYKRLSKIEKFVPLIMVMPYLCLFIYSTYSFIK